MSQAILSIESDTPANPRTTAHLLPCRVHYDGPVEPAQSYWSPTGKDDDGGARSAYFRGRKLHGKTVKVPAGYRGVVVEKSGAPPSATTAETGPEVVDALEHGGEEEEVRVPLGRLETRAEFEELVVWGHEAMADAASDPYVRIEEWTRLAEQIHSYPVGGKSS